MGGRVGVGTGVVMLLGPWRHRWLGGLGFWGGGVRGRLLRKTSIAWHEAWCNSETNGLTRRHEHGRKESVCCFGCFAS